MAREYLRFNTLKDVLYRADYSHVDDLQIEHDGDLAETDSEAEGETSVDEEDGCQLCDKTKIVKRKVRRKMRLHYGLIASGNQVIKDAIFRDRLNKDLGGNILCVEMEAAGLMTNVPCAVIRGICDYADSHKNKVWQKHAAAVAAAVAKEILGYVQPNEVNGEPTVRDVLENG